MKTLKAAVLSLLTIASLSANATVIDFSAEASGLKANGYTVQGVQFFDTQSNNLRVGNFGHQSQGNALAIFNDDPSMLRMSFGGIFDSLALDFGNDDASYSQAGDLAMLTLLLSGSQVGQTTVALNRDDIMNQTISLSGINFDEAVFGYVNPSLQAINLIEIVDNITFDRVGQVPEPSVLALLGLGLFGVFVSRRRSIA